MSIQPTPPRIYNWALCKYFDFKPDCAEYLGKYHGGRSDIFRINWFGVPVTVKVFQGLNNVEMRNAQILSKQVLLGRCEFFPLVYGVPGHVVMNFGNCWEVVNKKRVGRGGGGGGGDRHVFLSEPKSVLCQYIAMETFETSMERWIADERPTASQVRNCVSQVLNICFYLRDELKLIHADLHVGNVVLDAKGDARLIDFEEMEEYDGPDDLIETIDIMLDSIKETSSDSEVVDMISTLKEKLAREKDIETLLTR